LKIKAIDIYNDRNCSGDAKKMWDVMKSTSPNVLVLFCKKKKVFSTIKLLKNLHLENS